MPSPATPNDYPLELPHPDISAHAPGNNGIPYIYTFQSGQPGPHVMVSAVVHGNELCGAIVVDWLLRENVRPVRGTLSLGFMNVAAYQSYDPASPNASRFVDEDFNRLWTDEVLDSNRDSVELRRAREVRPLIAQVDFLLDIHSMQHPAVPLMMAGPRPKGRQLAAQVGTPQKIVSDAGHAAGRRMRDYGAFIDDASPKNALLVECGQHWAASSGTLAFDCAIRFLRVTGVVDDGFAPSLGKGELPGTEAWEVSHVVTIKTDEFRFESPFSGGEIIAKAGTLIGFDGDEQVTTPYDNCMLVMPSRRLFKGQTAVRLAQKLS